MIYSQRRTYTSLLDVGCGPATKTKLLLANHFDNITLVDHSSTSEVAKSVLPNTKFIGTDLNAPAIDCDQRFDAIICADVIEHLARPEGCLKLIHEHLQDDGCAFISTPERDVMYGKNCRTSQNKAHVREWNSNELQKLLQEWGFQIEAIKLLPPRGRSNFLKAISSLARPFWRNTTLHGCQLFIVRKA